MQMDFFKPVHSPIEKLELPEADAAGVRLSVLREDQIHAEVSGNKWRKLKYNVLEVMTKSQKGIVTKGGPFSNHLLATAAACHSQGLRSQAFLRGECHDNPTLLACQNYGMTIIPTSRADYKADTVDLMSRHELYSDEWWPVPEGGSNALGLKRRNWP
jgi:1-aminocyclopropane-1-carboxylate deaminase